MRILFMLLLMPSLMMAQTKKIIDKKKSTITYSMNHLLHAWDGTSSDLNGVVVVSPENTIQKVAIVSKVSAFDSKSSNRDAHMLEVTEALRFPNITFSSTSIIEPKNGELEIKGTLQFHGVSKDIIFKGSSKNDGTSTNVTGEFIFLLEDFKIDRPSFMLQKVDNEVKVKFDIFF